MVSLKKRSGKKCRKLYMMHTCRSHRLFVAAFGDREPSVEEFLENTAMQVMGVS
jgi:hypothetical protein